MAYINSAGVKLPNADIIIEANEDGTVTSCRDAVTGNEYVGGGYLAATLTIKNNSTTARTITLPHYDNSSNSLFSSSVYVAAGATSVVEVPAPLRISKPTPDTTISGNISLYGTSYYIINGNGEIIFI